VDSFREQIEELGKSRQKDTAAGQMSLLPSQGRDGRKR